MALSFNLPGHERSIIKVIGVGGGGGNAVETMFDTGIRGVDFVICNTDAQVLQHSRVPHRIQIGAHLTNGLGCGAKPEVGRDSALESIQEVQEMLRDGTKMVFVTAGMGGGTGTGAAPVIAALAREMGILTVGIVTTPFKFEGQWRMQIANEGLEELRHCVDSLLVINNNNLLEICDRNIRARDAYKLADSVLGNAARGIAEIITVKGEINVDFADVQTIMKNSGTALMGMASYAGDNRALQAVEDALASPLLNNADIYGAKGVLVNICAHPDSLRMNEVQTIMDYVMEAAGHQAACIFGQVEDESMGEELRVTVIATGFDVAPKPTKTETSAFAQRYGNLSPATHTAHRNRNNARKNAAHDVPSQPELFHNALAIPAFNQPSTQPAMEAPPHVQEPVYEAPKVEAPATPEPPARKPATPEPPASRELRRISPEERLNKLSTMSKNYDYHNHNRLAEMENQPAYLRRGVPLEVDGPEAPRTYSRLSVEVDAESRQFTLRNNSFLFDNVD